VRCHEKLPWFEEERRRLEEADRVAYLRERLCSMETSSQCAVTMKMHMPSITGSPAASASL
jgi:hypothetical protein